MITTTVKIIDQQIRKLSRLRRVNLVLSWLSLGAGILDWVFASGGFGVFAGGFAIGMGLVCSYQSRRLRQQIGLYQRQKRLLLHIAANGTKL